MRLFAIILSIYITALTAIPCFDKPQDNSLVKTEIAPLTTGNHQQEVDHCSPFCTCNCCSSPKIQQEIVLDFNCSRIVPFYFAENTPTFVSATVGAIWQPPRIN